MDKRDPNAVEALAREFVCALVDELGVATVQEVARLNAAEQDRHVCHSHDVCDSNMTMHRAQGRLGLDLDTENEDDRALWNAAWDLAVKHGFWVERFGDVWAREFGIGFAVPPEILGLVQAGEVQDLSWHNDVSPSFGVFDLDTEREVRLWVSHPDPDRRELGGPRFNVSVAVEHSPVGDAIQTDDVQEAVRVLREQLVKFKARS